MAGTLHVPCLSRNVYLHGPRVGAAGRRAYAFAMNYQDRARKLKVELGARLKGVRERKRLSQADVAQLLGEALGKPLPASRIGNYEQGTRLPSPIDVAILAALLGTTEGYLYGFEDDISQDERALLAKYRLTDERGKKTIQGIADAQPPYVSGGDTEVEKANGTRGKAS
jgi:transcriptional regulator with XRE-family HTH domain